MLTTVGHVTLLSVCQIAAAAVIIIIIIIIIQLKPPVYKRGEFHQSFVALCSKCYFLGTARTTEHFSSV